MPVNNDRTAKRRVPDALRKRTLISCDRCKLKRSRCIRSNESEVCASCATGGFKCESTVPRKQRVYGSVESLSLRYRTLEALVKGLFPDDDTSDISTLFRLAKENQIVLPSSDVSNAINEPVSPNNKSSTLDSTTSTTGQEEKRAKQGSGEKLIPAPHGVPHYIGPASTFEFATAIRKLVAKYNAAAKFTSDQTSQSQLRADFANMKVSIALEPRVHPTTTASEFTEDYEPGGTTGGIRSIAFQPETPSVTSPGSSVGTRNQLLAEALPNRDLSDELVQAFFDNTHSNYVLFHRGLFQAQYESIWQVDQDPPDAGWVCCLLMILAFGAQVLEGHSPEQAIAIQKRSLRAVRQRFHRITFTASLSNIQALLLLQLFEYNAGERNTAWLHLGLAARMAIALGMHREGTSKIFEPIERNTRRVVWFTLYKFEIYISIALGRPSIIDLKDINVSLPDQHLMDGGDHPPNYMQHSTSLTTISVCVRNFVSKVSSKLSGDTELLSTCSEAQSLIKELQNWINHLPRHLRPEFQSALPRHRRAVLLMHIYCHHLQSVVSRSYLLYTVNRYIDDILSPSPKETESIDSHIRALSRNCSQSTTAIFEHLQQMSDELLFDGVTWLDFYFVYHNILVASLAVLWQQYDPTVWEDSTSTLVSNIQSMMLMCQRNRLAQTYQILLRVAFQFAHIVGIQLESTVPMPETQETSTSGTVDITSTELFSQNYVAPLAEDEAFDPIPDTLGLYYSGSDGLDLDMFNFGEIPNDQIWGSSRPFPPPAETVGEPGLMVYGQSNPWRG